MRVTVADEERTPSIAQRTVALADETLAAVGVQAGDPVLVRGDDRTALTAIRWTDGPAGTAALTETDRQNVGVEPSDAIRVEPVELRPASRVTVRPLNDVQLTGVAPAVANVVRGHPLTAGDALSVQALALTVQFMTDATTPDGPVLVGEDTEIDVAETGTAGGDAGRTDTRLDELGGVDETLAQLRRSLVLPLTDREAVGRLGATDGVLLVGPSGSGKTALGTALGDLDPEVDVLRVVPGGQYDDGGIDTAAVRSDAREQAPVVVFLDDLDVLAPAPNGGSVDADSAPLARLVAELVDTDGVSVLGATTDPESVAPGLRGGGRLSGQVTVPTPDREARREMLGVHFESVPLDGVALGELAARTHGYLAGDLAALASETVRHAVARHDEAGTLDHPQAAVGEMDAEAALEAVTPSELEGFAVARPGVDYDDIGGLTDVKRELVRSVEWPLLYPDLFEQVHRDPPAGVLLYGPPGTGKTMLAKAVATSGDANFIAVSGPELFDRYVGESERAVREVFERARQTAPTVVFFDEVDALAARRDDTDETGVTDRVVSQLLTELDGIEPSEGVVPVGATNRPDLVDPALLRPGRFERVLEVPLPDRAARAEIFGVHLAEVPTAGTVDVDELAAATEGYSGSDVAAAVREAGLLAMEETIGDSAVEDPADADVAVTMSHLRRAVDEVDRSVTDEMRETYAAYAAEIR